MNKKRDPDFSFSGKTILYRSMNTEVYCLRRRKNSKVFVIIIIYFC